MIIRKSVLLVLLFSNFVFAKKAPLSHPLYDQIYLGEKRLKNYSGPLDPRFNEEYYTGKLSFADDSFANRFFVDQINSQILDIENFWFSHIPVASSCSNDSFAENFDYIAYLYRLQSMSYLFEGLKALTTANYKLTGELKSCSISYEDVFSKCLPKSIEMKKFLKRAKARYLANFYVGDLVKLKKSETREHKKNLYRKNGDLSFSDLYMKRRVLKSCPECFKKDFKYLSSKIVKACNGDKQEILKLCSEEDQLYGVSKLNLISNLIINSNAFKVINTTYQGKGCLKRYVRLFKSKETNYLPLTEQSHFLYSELKKDQNSYAQGELFLPGALKEFDDKGLTDLVFVDRPKKATPTPTATPTPAPLVVVNIATPTPIATIAPTPTPVPTATPRPRVVLSAFETAVKIQKTFNAYQAAVNMKKLKNEFTYSKARIKKLDEVMVEFRTVKALKDMKKYDALGSKEAPYILDLLAYMLNQGQHQSLHNIVQVLGSKFYVLNDIEKKKEPVKIEIKNDESTNYQWQLYILKAN